MGRVKNKAPQKHKIKIHRRETNNSLKQASILFVESLKDVPWDSKMVAVFQKATVSVLLNLNLSHLTNRILSPTLPVFHNVLTTTTASAALSKRCSHTLVFTSSGRRIRNCSGTSSYWTCSFPAS